ncbi:MAG: hypothetical protein AAFS12_00255 [Cyanobacteria bacterium J06632_19]
MYLIFDFTAKDTTNYTISIKSIESVTLCAKYGFLALKLVTVSGSIFEFGVVQYGDKSKEKMNYLWQIKEKIVNCLIQETSLKIALPDFVSGSVTHSTDNVSNILDAIDSTLKDKLYDVQDKIDDFRISTGDKLDTIASNIDTLDTTISRIELS